MLEKKCTYFVSDFHLGTDGSISSKDRELKIIRFLDSIKEEAKCIYFLGDVFDYWFEYKRVIPKGYVRFLGKIAELKDAGIEIVFFTGNHDVWMFNYFQEELNIPVHKKELTITIDEMKFHLGHGDGLGPGDLGYKRLKKIFTNPLLQRLYGSIHPNIGLKIMKKFSKTSRDKNDEIEVFLGPEKEWLVHYSELKIKEEEFDFLIFGHRHLPIDYTLSNGKTRYINLGDWLNHCSYARFDGKGLQLLFFENKDGKIHN